MLKRFSLVALILLLGTANALGADLYRVLVPSHAVAERLAALDIEPVVRLSNGYLVLVESDKIRDLGEAGTQFELIERDITKDELAVDTRLDLGNVGMYPLVYEEDNLRIFRAKFTELAQSKTQIDLAPVSIRPMIIEYNEPRRFDKALLAAGVDLDSLIGLVSEDSLISYTERLQAYYRRLSGSDSCYAAAEWTKEKFMSFGYDSVYTDSFTTSISGSPTIVKNTIAVKVGTLRPNRYIVVGGHRDGVSSSPAADDNGSGTAGTLEIARAMSGIETAMTFIFITFSGEEQGLLGAYHYADNAAANGDTIDYMLNMDMIAHYENTTQANLFYGSDNSYSILWQELADSLVGISGVLAGSSGGSDHYPFAQNGYTVTFVHEYIFSTVYHSYRDSTSYMDFDYMTKLVKASLATVYAVMQDVTAPRIEFAYPAGVPFYLEPDVTTPFDLQLNPVNGAELVPGTAMLNYSIDGAPVTSVALTQIFENLYQAELPAVTCDEQIGYYVSAEDVYSGMYYDPPPSDPNVPWIATSVIASIDDNFETDQGWIASNLGATSGDWQRGIPVNDPGWDYDPVTDGDGSGRCFLTQNQTGNTDVDGGAVRLTSPTCDMSNGGLISYEYFLFLTNVAGGIDKLLVEINSEGGIGTWTEIANHDTDGGLTWRHHEITEAELIAAGVDLTSTMKIRFTANDDDPQSIVEAGLDGFSVLSFECSSQQWVCGDADSSGEVDIDDAVFLIAYIFAGGPAPDPIEAGDADCTGAIDIDDAVYLITYIFASGPVPCADC
ncbi:MAG: M28 family peptidase [Candidatus Zixiibacteriota bacterium]